MINQIKIEQLSAILNVLKLAEKLKFELRHSWLSNGRQESVAEHTWRMSLDQIRNPDIKKIKQQNEEKAISNIKEMLTSTNGQEIYDLFYEFEQKNTFEAKVANAIDKLEVQLQHNHADISTWEEIEYDLSFVIGKHVQFDETFVILKDLIEKQAAQKLEDAGLNVSAIRNRAIASFS
ncbi:HD domain-containing protein [Sphingobacterium sp.]|uniref:HD domain-containing protein n=1 Tax=Sphingobacterium sp. TaxID=341027 RepID=UPI0031DD1038